MIRSIEINGLRGIKEGKLDDLAPLSILVGPNGSGKSTVLDALLIAASNDTPDALIRAVERRAGVKRGARWLFWRGGQAESRLVLATEAGIEANWRFWFDSSGGSDIISGETPTHDNEGLIARVAWETNGGQFENKELELAERFTRTNGKHDFRVLRIGRHPLPKRGSGDVRLVDASEKSVATPLHQLYTKLVEQGRGREAKQLIAAALKGVVDIEILTEGDTPVVHLVFADHSVPAAIAGDGVQMVLRLSLELASRSGGLVLLEEPEVHQHPGTIRQSALAILASIRRGVQVVLTTHSLELIDALLSQASEDDLKQIAVFRVQLEDGVLKSSRLPGPEAAFARSQIEDDLR